jgi:hypothetical protein
MPSPPMAAVGVLRVHTVKLPHPRGRVAIRPYHQVVVVGHQAVGMTNPVPAPYEFPYQLKEPGTVLVVFVLRARAGHRGRLHVTPASPR